LPSRRDGLVRRGPALAWSGPAITQLPSSDGVERQLDRRIELVPEVEKSLAPLPPKERTRIARKIDLLTVDPRPPICKKLTGSDSPLYRIASGDYRILYFVRDEDSLVLVARIWRSKERLPRIAGIVVPPRVRLWQTSKGMLCLLRSFSNKNPMAAMWQKSPPYPAASLNETRVKKF
jgi:mRNA interferase RelE/StbE